MLPMPPLKPPRASVFVAVEIKTPATTKTTPHAMADHAFLISFHSC
jgi:hypothetical protein